ncbi:cyclase family protein [Pelagibacterium lacus]|uniref:Cyclase family protein n=1 Tax=Pelagibacterium lacus TaxID=2282655 RepID=A0A369W125_9HYPH|nr:cyclase family protein [Pelagibacterium lacus]
MSVTDPISGLVFTELGHEWGHGTPSMPGHDDVLMWRSVKHAQHGVMAHRIRMVMHSGTHLNAPIHLIQGGDGVGAIALDRLFGNGVVVSIPKSRWDLVEVADLEKATPPIGEGDMVVIVTGWHRKFSDSLEYFGESPGLSKSAAEWLVMRKVRLVAMDTPQIDHPLATSLGLHRGGPLMNRLPGKYQEETGRDPRQDHPEWNVAHKTLLEAGIPTVENVGGDVEEVLGQRAAFHALPWRWLEGDACVIRFIAMTDPANSVAIESGTAV